MTAAKLIHVVGARPNFMKIAPIMRAVSAAASRRPIDQVLVHTGQHWSPEMSDLFFKELGLPQPDINLGVGSATHGRQTGRIMEAFEEVLEQQKPTAVLVVGDVNSTIACAMDATKLGVRVIHVEAGLRSFDRTMPEEVNRVLTDAISDLLFTTEQSGNDNLIKEGIPAERVKLVGNVMIDTLVQHKTNALARPTLTKLLPGTPLQKGGYGIVTLHRPSNVDDPATLKSLMGVLAEIAKDLPLVFPAHPRTKANMEKFGLHVSGLHLVEPQGYLDFLNLTANARLVLTDSGGIQEETTILGVPCLTLRENTERPITITHGTNRLVGTQPSAILSAYRDISQSRAKPQTPPLWDGAAAERIADVLVEWL